MSEGEDNIGRKFDFNSVGETPGYITLDQARVLAMQMARADPVHHRRFEGVRMVFGVEHEREGEDFYTVILSFRPEGDFEGIAGQEQFIISKIGEIVDRGVLRYPRRTGQSRFPVKWAFIGLAVVAVGAVLALVVMVVTGDGDGPPSIDFPILTITRPPARTVAPTALPTATTGPVPTAAAVPTLPPTVAATVAPTPKPKTPSMPKPHCATAYAAGRHHDSGTHRSTSSHTSPNFGAYPTHGHSPSNLDRLHFEPGRADRRVYDERGRH